MSHHPGGQDNLFDPDRPLGTFSAKIALAYRLNLIDRHIEHSLQMVRKIRNDFAHSINKASLSESHHKSRVIELAKGLDEKVKEIHSILQTGVFDSLKSKGIGSKELVDFCVSVALLLVSIELAKEGAEPVKPSITASISSALTTTAKTET